MMKYSSESFKAGQKLNNDSIVKHYQKLYQTHGNAPGAVQWADVETQYKRFEILSRVTNSLSSIIDLGCGLGEYYKYLKLNNHKGRYLGVDIVPEFVRQCETLCEDDVNASVTLANDGKGLPRGYDYVIASGIFNNKRDDNLSFMMSTIEEMISAAEVGVAFNALSTYVEYEDESLYYSNPLEVFEYLKRDMKAHPILKHDYILSKNRFPYEYTIYAYKKPVIYSN